MGPVNFFLLGRPGPGFPPVRIVVWNGSLSKGEKVGYHIVPQVKAFPSF